MTDIEKAKMVTNPNDYIWIVRGKKDFLLDRSDVFLKVYSKEKGVAYYYEKDKDKESIVAWRFEKDKGWTEDNAKIFATIYKPTKKSISEAIEYINEYNGSGELLSIDIRKTIYEILTPHAEKFYKDIPKLNTQIVYKTIKSMKDKMKQLVELANESFYNFITQSLEERPNVVKNKELKKSIENEGYKFFGNLDVYKTITPKRTEKGEMVEEERWMLKTTFTSNKADSDNDVTSKKAIVEGINELKGKVIPIRLEHDRKQDYGVWYEFNAYEKDGVLYGEAIGELDKELHCSQDLWKAIYERGKKFATSYGGRCMDYYYDKAMDGTPVRVLNSMRFEEISLTTLPANPDTAIEAMNKYASKLEATLDETVLDEIAKAKWTTAYINTLPNSAFVIIEPAYLDGKTEDKRARHLPYKDTEGAVDLPHLRNALARVNQLQAVTDSISTEELRSQASSKLEKLKAQYLKEDKTMDKQTENTVTKNDLPIEQEQAQQPVVAPVTAPVEAPAQAEAQAPVAEAKQEEKPVEQEAPKIEEKKDEQPAPEKSASNDEALKAMESKVESTQKSLDEQLAKVSELNTIIASLQTKLASVEEITKSVASLKEQVAQVGKVTELEKTVANLQAELNNKPENPVAVAKVSEQGKAQVENAKVDYTKVKNPFLTFLADKIIKN